MSTGTGAGLKSWTTRDLLVVAVIGITAAVALMGINYLAAVLVAINPIVGSVLAGVFFIFIILPLYIVQRAGAAILATLVYGLASAPLHPFGWGVSLLAFIFAVPVEIPFLLTRYRNYSLKILMLGGAAGCFLSFLATGVYGDYASLAFPVQLGTLIVYLLSGALIGGCLSKALADSLVKTGVLNSFAIARTQQEEI